MLKANSFLWSINMGTDAYGFSALPGGFFIGSYFKNVGSYGNFWLATEYDADNANRRYMFDHYANVFRNYYSKEVGLSVRCVQD